MDITGVIKNTNFLTKKFLSWDSFLLVCYCLFMLGEGGVEAGLFNFFFNKVEAMEYIRPFCATTVSIPLTYLRP